MQITNLRQLRITDYDLGLYERALAAVGALVDNPKLWRHVNDGLTTFAGRESVPSELLPAMDASELLWRLNKSIHNPDLRHQIATRIAAAEMAHAPVEGRLSSADAADSRLSAFLRDGLVELPPLLNPDEIAEVIAHLNRQNEVVADKSLRHHGIQAIVRAPHVIRAVSEPWLLDLIERYLGMPPTLVDISLWESCPGHAEPWGAQIFHRDRDDFRACKLFVYFNDVGPDHGPHIFVKGSHAPHEIKVRVPAIDDTILFALFQNDGRQVSRAIERLFGASVTEVTGPAGATFLENTYGFHRGKVPKAGSRLMLQAMFACIPYLRRVSRLGSSPMDQLPSACPDSPRTRHALRLLL